MKFWNVKFTINEEWLEWDARENGNNSRIRPTIVQSRIVDASTMENAIGTIKTIYSNQVEFISVTPKYIRIEKQVGTWSVQSLYPGIVIESR